MQALYENISTSRAGRIRRLSLTAHEVGITNLSDPESGVLAGLIYLDRMWQRFEAHIPSGERAAFSLAAYNAGFGHVSDARKVARRKGWNPNLWFNNVERAMLMLSRREVARTVRYGFCRGTEPVRYMRQIAERFRVYLILTDG